MIVLSLIKIENVSKIYKNGSLSVTALENINISVEKGELLGIIGASGSGKSTLMNIIGCLDYPTKGEYFLNGRNVVKMKEKNLSKIRRENIGFVFQKFNLIPTLSAFENVALPLLYLGIDKNIRKERVRQALSSVALENRINHKPSELSGGQQQRVAIARAIVTNPEIILADEPTGNLDSKSSDQIMQLLSLLNSQGKTIVLITHDEKTAEYSTRKIKVEDGKIVNAFWKWNKFVVKMKLHF